MAELSEETTSIETPPPKLDEAEVVAWLKAHPDVLTRHPAVLESIEISHAAGSAVSLIERQVELLRGKNARLESRLDTLIETARANESRADKVLALSRALIRAPSLAAIAVALKCSMREDFDVDDVFLGLNGTAFKRHDIDGVVPIDAGGAIARAYDNFIRTRLVECGPITPERGRLLFPKAEGPILSAAVVPMERDKNLGMIALGSRDAERFQPRQGKLFLEMTAELVAAAVRARLA